MKTIETPYALLALRKMAEYAPQRLLRMEKEEPEKLLSEIETRVTNALGWIDTAVAKGEEKAKMQAMMDQLLKPDIDSGDNEPVKVSEHKIFEIHQKLIGLA
jgi:hypothetical protein